MVISEIQFKEDKRVIEVLKDIADVIVMADGRKVSASQLLQHLCLCQICNTIGVSKLSGMNAGLFANGLDEESKLLILDEPTNDLDLLTLNK